MCAHATTSRLVHLSATVACAWFAAVSPASARERPNVVLIYTDDLGYGDLSSYGATALRTPHIDRLAREGLRFTDAHSAAATCTPSRYALLTGEYAWRKPGTNVLPGDAALIVEPGRATLPLAFQNAGYATGVVGKWHLGLGPAGGPDWNGGVAPGPREVGFGYSFIMAATGDRVPTVYIEDGRVVGLDPADPIRVSYGKPIGDWPTGKSNPDRLTMRPSHGHDQTIVNGISRIGYMAGGKAAWWNDEDMADVFTARAIAFVEKNRQRPFFLFFATHDPHVPRVPHPRFAGTTGLGPRGDAIAQADASVGEILGALDRLDLSRDTLVLFTSDNGPVLDDGYRDDAVARLGRHQPAGELRGGKYSNFEGGTRVPFIVRWPGPVKPGVSDALVSQVDLLASFGGWIGQPPPPATAPDSQDVLAALLGTSQTGREALVEQAGALSLRHGSWKYIEPSAGPAINKMTNTELGNAPVPQLYDLARDPGERRNLAAARPDQLRRMRARLQEVRAGTGPPDADRPNILLIQADDLGYGDLSAYGQARFRTPFLDRLAREGTRFTQYYAGSTVCAPSRAVLLTGLHTGHAWIRGNGEFPLRPEDVTIAEVLRDAGYRTAVIGKWGLGRQGTTGQPDRQGFDHAFGFLDHRHAHRQYTDHLWRNGERIATDLDRDYVNDLFTREASAFIERPDRRPFFLYLNYTVPHAELRVPDESLATFRGRFPERPFANAKADARTTGPDEVSLGYRSQPTPRAAFAAMVTRMDRNIGHLMEVLRARGLERRTLVLFSSDNGPHHEGGGDPVFFESSGGLRGMKRDLYEGGIRVPMIARWPGKIPAGRVSDQVWGHWDLLPTLGELAVARVPAGLDGVSMVRALRGGSQPGERFLYWEFHERGFQQAVRIGAWKAVRLFKDGRPELYDLPHDPGERHDVAAAHPEIVTRIEEYLKSARTESSLWPVE